MSVESLALWLVAAFCAAAALLGAFARKREDFAHRLIGALWLCACAFALILLGTLVAALVSLRFEFRTVVEHASRDLPVAYRVSALWAGQAGSFLLWLAILLPMGFVLLHRSMTAFTVFSLVALCIAIMTAVSDPFARCIEKVTDGAGLTPALQNPWMVVHPPLVFVGYSAMAVLASFASADVNEAVLRKTSRVSLLFLGLGIFTGSVWAYYALGWGGYWAWDPIENAALVPWLLLCAFLHDPKPINKVKRIAPFALACLGTFLTRSGVLADASAHAYVGASTAVTVLLLALLAAALVLCVVYALNLRKKKADAAVRNKTAEGSARRKTLDLLGLDPILGMRLFARVTYGYAALILLGTLLPLLSGAPTPAFAYNALTIAYALACCALLLLRQGELLVRRGLIVMFIATALVFAIMFAFGSANAAALVLLWFFLLPFALFVSGGARADYYSLSHIALLLLFVGVLCSGTLGASELAIYSPADSTLFVQNHALRTVLRSDFSILSTPFADYIVHSAQAIESGANTFVPYETKPLIYLYWIGGFGMLALLCGRLLIPFFKRKKKNP